MGLSSRLQTFGYLGYSSPPAFTLAMTGKDAARVRTSGIRRLGNKDAESPPLILDYGLAWPDALNDPDQYSGTGTDYLKLSNIGNRPALAYEQAKAGEPAAFTSTFSIGINQPFALRLFIFDAPKADDGDDQPKGIIQARWNGWQFTFHDGSPYIQRFKSTWNQSDEDDLYALLDLDEPDATEQGQIQTLRGTLYEIEESLSLNGLPKIKGGDYIELTVIPEALGRLNVICGGDVETFDIESILAGRTTGTVYGAGALVMRSRGGQFIWQYGYPVFNAEGVLEVPFKDPNNFFLSALGDTTFSIYRDEPTGTEIEMDTEAVDSVNGKVTATLSTTSNRYTPFLYFAQATIAGGQRTGDTAETFDTDDFSDNPILDVSMSCDAEMRRQSYTVYIRDINGTSLDDVSGEYIHALENRTATLAINGTAVVTNGIMNAASLANTTGATPNVVRSAVTGGATVVEVQLCDGWQILDDDLMSEQLIGDGLKLGAYILQHLTNAGFKTAEMAGVSATDGRLLPSAALGEEPCIVAGIGESRGEHLRDVVTNYGMSWQLYQSAAGVWTFAARPTSTKSLYGHSVHFKRSSTQANDPTQYPNRFAVLGNLEHVRDFGESYNYFRVEGAQVNGRRIVQEWYDWESVHFGSGSGSRKFIGRLKKYPAVRDDGLRTADDVAWVLRSLRERFARPGRFYNFETYYHPGLQVGDRVLLDTLPCEVVQIGGASIASDRMSLTLQEVV